jgi:hypothetical protein
MRLLFDTSLFIDVLRLTTAAANCSPNLLVTGTPWPRRRRMSPH